MTHHTSTKLNKLIHPRAELLARGAGKPPRASDIILGMTLTMLLVVLLALALTHLFTTA